MPLRQSPTPGRRVRGGKGPRNARPSTRLWARARAGGRVPGFSEVTFPQFGDRQGKRSPATRASHLMCPWSTLAHGALLGISPAPGVEETQTPSGGCRPEQLGGSRSASTQRARPAVRAPQRVGVALHRQPSGENQWLTFVPRPPGKARASPPPGDPRGAAVRAHQQAADTCKTRPRGAGDVSPPWAQRGSADPGPRGSPASGTVTTGPGETAPPRHPRPQPRAASQAAAGPGRGPGAWSSSSSRKIHRKTLPEARGHGVPKPKSTQENTKQCDLPRPATPLHSERPCDTWILPLGLLPSPSSCQNPSLTLSVVKK